MHAWNHFRLESRSESAIYVAPDSSSFDVCLNEIIVCVLLYFLWIPRWNEVKYFCARVAVVNERSLTIVPKGLQHRLADDFTTLTETRKFFFPPSLLHTIFFSLVDLYFYVSEEFELTHIQSRTGLNGNRNNNMKQTSSFLLCFRFFSPKAPAKKTRQKSASVCVFKSRYVEKCIGLLCHKLLSFLVYYTINDKRAFFGGAKAVFFGGCIKWLVVINMGWKACARSCGNESNDELWKLWFIEVDYFCWCFLIFEVKS